MTKVMNTIMSVAIAAVMMLGFAMSADAYTHSVLLKVGSNGSQVMEMQSALNAAGANPALVVDGIFGNGTKAAVMNFQAANGLVADGIVGAMTGAKLEMNEGGSSSSNGDGTKCPNGYLLSDNCMPAEEDSALEGSVGDITLSASSDFSGEEVGEGEEDVEVMSVDIEAGDDSDVQIKSVKIEFQQESGADSDKLDDYASEVSVWYMGDEVARVDVDDFAESSDYYSKSISLDNVIIRAGEEEALTFAVSALNNLDSGDIDSDDWNIDLINVRFMDADGVVTTESADAAKDASGTTYQVDFDFGSFSTVNDAELTVSLEDDAINDAHVLDVDDASDTEHEILSFSLDASGDSDIWIDEIPVVITTTGELDEAVIVVNATLYIDGEKMGTEDVPTGGAVTFDNLDYTLDAGDEVEAIVEVKLQDTDGALDDADTVQATVTVASIDAEDEVGDSVTATGSAAADAHTAYEAGIMVDLVSTDATVDYGDPQATNDHDLATFTITFEVTAFDGDMYIDNTNPTLAGGATESDLDLEQGTGTIVSADIDSEGADEKTNSFLVEEGQTEEFTITAVVTPTADGLFQLSLGSVLYATTDVDGDTVYNFNLDDFKTKTVYLNNDAA